VARTGCPLLKGRPWLFAASRPLLERKRRKRRGGVTEEEKRGKGKTCRRLEPPVPKSFRNSGKERKRRRDHMEVQGTRKSKIDMDPGEVDLYRAGSSRNDKQAGSKLPGGKGHGTTLDLSRRVLPSSASEHLDTFLKGEEQGERSSS